jgi:cyclophilin family peptidyl-prolyl cis-trans isomerase
MNPMKHRATALILALLVLSATRLLAAPVLDALNDVTIPAGKSLILPVTATSPSGRPLTFSATSSTNGIAVIIHTNNPFWKMSVVQAAPANAPGAYQTPFRGGTETVTNVGDLTFMLFPEYAPQAVNVFKGLTASGFYNRNTIFHRVISGFMIQGGDPLTNGTGGPVFRYDDEWNPQAIFSGSGQLALANSGKDTDGSQFFVTVAPYRYGDFGYTIFGQLVRGFDVLSNINHTITDTNDRPVSDVIITHASFVPDTSDTVLTLVATNRSGVSGNIEVVANDGAGGRTTNRFTATVTADTNDNAQPFINDRSVTNLVAPINVTLTNDLQALGLNGETLYWWELKSITNAQISGNYRTNYYQQLTYNITNAQGDLQLFARPNTNFVGRVDMTFVVSSDPSWLTYYQYFPRSYWPPYDQQQYTFVFGDTPIDARATNFIATAQIAFTNQLLATFTNGVPGSDATNFTASINWGDNTTNNGVILSNANGWKEVRGSHTYTNAGTYPIYLKIQSQLGVAVTVISTASVPPSLQLSHAGSADTISWPAWATEYQLQSADALTGTGWQAVSNFPALNGYTSIVTNSATGRAVFFRLKK